MNRVYVFDENLSGKYQDALPKYCINARYLYFLCKLKKTYGQNDQTLLKCAAEKGFTIITKDKGLVLESLLNHLPIVYKQEGMYYLFTGSAEQISYTEFGEAIDLLGETEHQKILAERGWKA